jgi:proteasome lid subunit RPN8/RPN11
MRTGCFAALMALTGFTLLASDLPRPVRTWDLIVADPAILIQLSSMARLGTSRVNQTEAAAFLVRRSERALELVPWPDHFENHRQSWRGTVPAGAIAVVHTHPDRSPIPSRGDCELARSTGLAVVALSRWAIWVIEPDAAEPVPLVVRRNWVANAAQLAQR